MANKYIIVGLGNPGSKYAGTRHNLGFMVLDRAAARFNASFRSGRGDYLYTQIPLGEARVYWVKPLTYMNLSGRAVREAVNFWEIALDRVLVVYDDFNLPFGKMRIRGAGSDGGHNGMASVIQHLATDQVARLRFGVGVEKQAPDAVDFVLSKFSKAEQEALADLLDGCVDAVELFIRQGVAAAMNAFNG